jgi:hypothetical protein
MCIKIIFVVLTFIHIYLKFKQTRNKLDDKIQYWKDKTEFIFITFTAILMLYLFNPRSNNMIHIDNETKLLLFIFAALILFTENWEKFFSRF